MELRGKRFLVAGAGLSGIAAAGLLATHKYQVLLYDGNQDLDEAEIRKKSALLQEVEIILGDLPEDKLAGYDIAVVSPGIPTDSPAVVAMERAGLEIWGEIELASVFEQGRVLAVTGTNGKTTTTSLLGEVMGRQYQDVKVVGNIGVPYTSLVQDTTEYSVTVAEISSFQLETVHTFRPQVSAILNITPDHLNRHHTMQNYQVAKERIAKNQGKGQFCILNYEDPSLREFAGRIQAKPVFFSSANKLEEGMYLEGDRMIWAWDEKTTVVCSTKDLQLIGNHNYENAMAAAAMALVFGVPLETVQKALLSFKAVEHRIEYVTSKRGVRFYNDSKGTNPDAAIQAIRAMEWPTLLIGGGYDKASEFDAWIQAFGGKVKKLALLGATSEKIRESALRMGYPEEDIILTKSIQEAVAVCYQNAESGDAVLLSPACASWGMFDNYMQRGEVFKEAVWSLKE